MDGRAYEGSDDPDSGVTEHPDSRRPLTKQEALAPGAPNDAPAEPEDKPCTDPDIIGQFSIAEMEEVGAVLVKLDRSNAVRQVAEELIAGEPAAPRAIRPLLQALLRPSEHGWRERIAAAWTLGRGTLDAKQRSSALPLLRETLLYRRGPRLGVELIESFFKTIPAALVLGLLSMFLSRGEDTIQLTLAWGACLYPILFLVNVWRGYVQLQRVRAAAARALSNPMRKSRRITWRCCFHDVPRYSYGRAALRS